MNGHNENAVSCWEFWDCPKEIRNDCVAYMNDMGEKCYLVSPNTCPRRETTFEQCRECPWCEKNAPSFCKYAKDIAEKKEAG